MRVTRAVINEALRAVEDAAWDCGAYDCSDDGPQRDRLDARLRDAKARLHGLLDEVVPA
jgi:hypothetical protein